jgi:hypothetical protein
MFSTKSFVKIFTKKGEPFPFRFPFETRPAEKFGTPRHEDFFVSDFQYVS